MKIPGKVALITGGASGLGAASARAFCGAGGRVVLVDLNAELGSQLTASLGDDRARYVTADVADPAQMQAAVEAATRQFGRLDVVLNCAGIGGASRILGKDGPVALDWFVKIVKVNLIGTFNTTRLAAAAMAKNQPGEDGERGVVINTASAAAFEGQIGQVAYSASKGGIVGMTLPLARDLARHGIRVVTIAPGVFDTPLLGRLPEESRAVLCSSVPFPQRLGQPEEYARLVLQIIENSYLNGEVIRLDGALRMAPR